MSGIDPTSQPTEQASSANNRSVIIQQAAQLFVGLNAVWSLRCALGIPFQGAPDAAKHIIVNVLSCGSFFGDRSKLTEIGLVAFSLHDLQDLVAIGPGYHAENILGRVHFYHYRLISNAHLGISKNVAGSPENNRFGNTRFVDEKQMRDLLQDSFCWPIDATRPELGYCPIVLLGHTLDVHLQLLQQSLNVDISNFGTIVATTDTRQIAREIGMRGPHPTGLGHLMNRFGIAHRNVGTAGNDAAYTAIVSILMALSPELYYNLHPLDPANTAIKTPQAVVDAIEAHSKTATKSSYGVARYCTKCGRTGHVRKYCKTMVQCKKCLAAGREKSSTTHVDSRCGFSP
ncbi:hypothetical protein BDV96DRAFT_598253 [Lophiotrema nucula]|uniref:CCHC-type domain-containing protein n=1 Tax=Lophiotrema nucula TaxID=690887 RepID=A0A6A5ZCV2_9PLEO|nr:hypothetical protein BDV96DRAFT_598253 [Lophiotrema nucula]